jgi:hypothetical protein
MGGPPPGAPPGGFGGGPPAGPPPGGGFGAPAAGTVTCPNCGAANKLGFKFCGSCGTSLEGLQPGGPPPGGPGVGPAPSGPLPSGAGHGTLVLIRPDGTEGESIPFDQNTVLGRNMPNFASDTFLSPRHGTFHFGPQGLVVKDEDSLNGVYLRVPPRQPVPLEHGTVFRIGQEVIRYESLPPSAPAPDGAEAMGSPREGLVGRICLVIGRETTGNCYTVPTDGLHLGRERGDILFPDDGYVSGLHAHISYDAQADRVSLVDLESSNGTFLRADGEIAVPRGAMLLVGQQLFRVEY